MLKLFRLKSGNRLDRKDTFFQYSTEEQFTGEYWVDGKKIYCKTIKSSIIELKNGVLHEISDIGTYRAVDYNHSFWMVSADMYYPLSNYEASGAFVTPKFISATTVKIGVGVNWESSSNTVYITIRYTKIS